MSADRRSFLGRVVLGITGVISTAFAGAAGGYLFGAPDRGRRGRWSPVARLESLPSSQPLHIEFIEVVPDAWATIRRRRAVWLVLGRGKQVTAFDPHCTHLGCPYDWDPTKRVFICPCHGGVFDIDGQVVEGPPPRALDRVELRVSDDRVLVGEVIRSNSTSAHG